MKLQTCFTCFAAVMGAGPTLGLVVIPKSKQLIHVKNVISLPFGGRVEDRAALCFGGSNVCVASSSCEPSLAAKTEVTSSPSTHPFHYGSLKDNNIREGPSPLGQEEKWGQLSPLEGDGEQPQLEEDVTMIDEDINSDSKLRKNRGNWGVKARQEISSRIRKEENNTTNSDEIFKKKAPSTSYLNDHRFSPPRKIAIMIEPTPFTHISGYGNRFRYLLRNLERAGDDVHIVTTDDTKEAPNKFLKFPITNIRGFKCPMYDEVKLTIDPDGKGWELLGRLRPDLLHVSTPGFVCFPAIIYARVMRIPLVFSYHTDLAKYMKKYLPFPGFAYKLAYSIIRSVLNKADLNLVTSPQMKEEMEANGVQRVNVWRKGIDTEVFSPSHYDYDMRMRLSNGHPEDPLLVYVGRLAAEKRLRDIRDVLERIPGARVAFVGGGPDAKSLKRYYSGFNAVFMGSLSGEKLSQAFASGDIFLMPSDTETLGFVVLESMASGVPVVASNAGGIPDLIEDGVTGFLCEPGCVEEWVGRVKLLLDDEDVRNKMSAHARSETEKHSWEAATAYLRNVQYTKAINNFRFRDMRHLGAWSGQPRSRSFNRLRNVKREMETKRRVKYFRQILSRLENYIIRCVPEARLGYIPDQI